MATGGTMLVPGVASADDVVIGGDYRIDTDQSDNNYQLVASGGITFTVADGGTIKYVYSYLDGNTFNLESGGTITGGSTNSIYGGAKNNIVNLHGTITDGQIVGGNINGDGEVSGNKVNIYPGASIASFVYLRRIYEHMVEKEYANLPDTIKKSNASFDEKMKAVDNKMHIIPPELDSQKSKIYSVLSKGIHEYEEDECYELYPAMRTIIILMLESYLSDKESKQQLKEIEKTLKSK